jgi:hypothetical protein
VKADELNGMSYPPDCENAIELYGHSLAQMVLLAARNEGFVTQGRGPWLVAWVPSAKLREPDHAFFGLDLSSVETYADAENLFARWQTDIHDNIRPEETPTVERFRLTVRNWADEVGQGVLIVLGISDD